MITVNEVAKLPDESKAKIFDFFLTCELTKIAKFYGIFCTVKC